MDLLFSLDNGHSFGDGAASYTLVWTDAATLVITFDALSATSILAGDTLGVLAAADIRLHGGGADVCLDSAPIIGTWGTAGPDHLAFVVEPVDAMFDLPLPAIEVELLYPSGARATSHTDTIDVAIGTDPTASAVLSGTPSAIAVAGVAAFTGLSIDLAGDGFTLVASASGCTPATSDAFDILPLPPTIVSVTATPSSAAAYADVTIEVTVGDGSQPVTLVVDFGDSTLPYIETTSDGLISIDHSYATADIYAIHVDAWDAHDRTVSNAATSVTITTDSTPPVIAVEAPADWSTTYDDMAYVLGSADEPVALVTVNGEEAHVSVDGLSWYYATVLTYGTATLSIAGADHAGNPSTPFDVHVTREPASFGVTLSEPSSVQLVAGTGQRFSASAAGGAQPYAYEWDFGDGSALDTAPSPTHTYASAGFYLLRLRVTDSNLGTGDEAVVLDVREASPALVAMLTYSPGGPAIHQRVTFDATGSAGGIRRYLWDWGWGEGTDVVFDQFSQTGVVTHVFDQPGPHRVVVEVVDLYGQTDSTWIYVPVSDGGEAAVLDSDVTEISLQARPGIEQTRTAVITLTNIGLIGSVAAVTVDTSWFPEYLDASPKTLTLLSQESRAVTLTLDASLATGGVAEHLDETLLISANGATSTVDVEISIDLDPYGEDNTGCAAGGTRRTRCILWFAIALLAVIDRSRRTRGHRIAR